MPSRAWRRLSASVAAGLLLITSNPLPAAASAYNAVCDVNQGYVNSFRYRNAQTGASGPWIVSVEGYINGYNYNLCTLFNPNDPPWQSGSGAWFAFVPGYGANNIVQIGFFKCNWAPSCAPTNGGLDTGVLEWFYGWGVDGDPFKMPFPKKLATGPAPNANAKFKMQLVFGNPSHYDFYVNGQYLRYLSNEWQNWNARYVQVAVENWNQGDQLGGRPASGADPGNKQKFQGIYWNNQAATHYGEFGPIGASGHCFNWADSTLLNTSDWYVWTRNGRQAC